MRQGIGGYNPLNIVERRAKHRLKFGQRNIHDRLIKYCHKQAKDHGDGDQPLIFQPKHILPQPLARRTWATGLPVWL